MGLVREYSMKPDQLSTIRTYNDIFYSPDDLFDNSIERPQDKAHPPELQVA
jgi:hypothetical protein